jgi:hypothetical protein
MGLAVKLSDGEAARDRVPERRWLTAASALSSSVRLADARGRMKRRDDAGVARDAGLFALVPVSLF